MLFRSTCGRGNRHQPLHIECIKTTRGLQELGQIFRSDACFLWFCADIDLDKNGRVSPSLLYGLRQAPRELGSIQRFDHIEQLDRVDGLVRLEWADQTEAEIRHIEPARIPSCLGFLNPVFPEDSLTGLQGGVDRCWLLGFGDRDKRYVGCIASGSSGCVPYS